MNKFFVSALLLVFVFFSYGQTCTQRLNESEDDYEAGRLIGIPAKLKDCLAIKDGFTNEEAISTSINSNIESSFIFFSFI